MNPATTTFDVLGDPDGRPIGRVPLSLHHSDEREVFVLGDTFAWVQTVQDPFELQVDVYQVRGHAEPTIGLEAGEVGDSGHIVMDLTPAEARALVEALQKALGEVGR